MISAINGAAPRRPERHLALLRRCLAACLIGGTVAAMLTIAVNLYRATTVTTAQTNATASANQLLPASQNTAQGLDSRNTCHITAARSSDVYGDFVGFLSPSGAAKSHAANDVVMGGPMNPVYASDLVAVVVDYAPEGIHKVGVHVPRGMSVKLRDRVFIRAGHRETTRPCNWVPNLIVSVVPKP